MSFSCTRTFYVSGSVSYPASEHGGSTSYHDSVTVTVNVDTNPLEASIGQCASEVGSLRSSVDDAAARIVERKKASATKIADTMIGGFFSYIRKRIQTQVTDLQNKIPTLLATIKNLAKQCSGLRANLENDYQRITSQYAKVFDDLETNLKTSLLGLDGPAFNIVEQANDIALSAALQVSTTRAVLTGSELLSAENAIELSQVKRGTQKVVSEGARNIMYNIKLGKQIENMLRKGAVSGEHQIYMPVVHMASSDVEGGRKRSDYVFPAACPAKDVGSLYEGIKGTSGDGEAFANMLGSDASRAAIDRFFRARLSEELSSYADSDMANRFSAEVLRMWNGHVKG